MDDNRKLDEILKLVKENNSYIKSKRRAEFYGRVIKFIFIGIVLLSTYYFYAKFLPTLLNIGSQARETKQKVEDTVNTVNEYKSSIDKLVDTADGLLGSLR